MIRSAVQSTGFYMVGPLVAIGLKLMNGLCCAQVKSIFKQKEANYNKTELHVCTFLWTMTQCLEQRCQSINFTELTNVFDSSSTIAQIYKFENWPLKPEFTFAELL